MFPPRITSLLPAVDTGWEDLRLLRNECRKFMTGDKRIITQGMQEQFRREFNPCKQHVYLVGYGRPLGFLYLRERGTDTWAPTYGVTETERGHGYGRLLVRLSQTLCPRLVLNVQKKNLRARELYRRMGFVETAGDLFTRQMVWYYQETQS